MNITLTKKTLCATLLLAFTLSEAQNVEAKKEITEKVVSETGDHCFDENTRILNIGVGLGSNYYSAYRGAGYTYKSTPAFSISYEQAYPKKLGPGYLGIGAYLGYQTASSTYNYNYYYYGNQNNYYYRNSWSNFMIAARGAYHLDILNTGKAEVYGGLLLGLRIQTYHYETNNPDPNATNYRLSDGSTYPSFSIFAGGRWYFANRVALFGELGYGISYLTVGLSLKL